MQEIHSSCDFFFIADRKLTTLGYTLFLFTLNSMYRDSSGRMDCWESICLEGF